MPVSVTMPRLGESVSEGTVTRWLKHEGDRVEADEPLLEVSTDKVDTEIPAPTSGVLTSIRVGEDETVEVGAELATIDNDGAQASDDEHEQQAEQAQQAEDPVQHVPSQQAPTPAAPAQQEPPPAQHEPPPEVEQQKAEQQRPDQRHQPASSQPVPAQQPAPAQQSAAHSPQDAGAVDGQGAYVTPLVRKLAVEHDVDLAAVTGTGVGGRIRKQDVLDAARTAPAAPAAPADRAAATPPHTAVAAELPLRGRTEKMSRLRAVIASRMVESLHISAQLTTVVDVDVTRIARLRQQGKAPFEAQQGVKLSFLPFFALATVEALKLHPKVNASIDTEKGTVTYHGAEHLGIAVDTERGLLVPVIHDAGDLNLGGLARKIADLADRTRAGKVAPDELGGGTFTLTNTGSRGALFDTPIINQPQVGVLGTGSVVKRPVVVEDPLLGESIAVRSMVYLALSYDHRLVDGADAARFLATVKDRLEAGAFEAAVGL